MTNIDVNTIYVDRAVQHHQRVLNDALAEATSSYWQRRAKAFEDAAPRPGDHPGRSTAADLSAARERCLSVAAACRARASLEAPGGPLDRLVTDLWQVGA